MDVAGAGAEQHAARQHDVRRTPPGLQGRVSALVSLALFGPQAPMQALGSLAIRYLSYRQVYLAGAALAVAATGALIAFSRGGPRTADG